MARQREERLEEAGKRLKNAIKIIGKNYQELVDDDRWIKIVNVGNIKTIQNWCNKGVPIIRLTSIAEYFNIDPDIFLDIKNFEHEIRACQKNLKASKTMPSNFKSQNLTDIKTYYNEWLKKNRCYKYIENCIDKTKIDFNERKPFENERDEKFLTFLMVCSVHFGYNWRYWVERNLKNPKAIENLFYIINRSNRSNNSYVPVMRTLYILQKFLKYRITEYMKNHNISEDLKNVIEEYVLNDTIIDYFLIQRKKKHLQKEIDLVLKELKDFWNENIPNWGLFGIEEHKEHNEMASILQFESKTLRIDAAAPSKTSIHNRIDLIVQVCIPESPSLGVEDWPISEKPNSIVKKSDSILVDFPIDKTGNLITDIIEIKVKKLDFLIEEDSEQHIEIPPKEGSTKFSFNLIAIKEGVCRISIEIKKFENKVWLGALHFEIKVNPKKSLPVFVYFNNASSLPSISTSNQTFLYVNEIIHSNLGNTRQRDHKQSLTTNEKNKMGANLQYQQIHTKCLDDIEKAIKLYEQEVNTKTDKITSMDLSTIKVNLGYAYLNHFQGDRKKNIENAIKAFQQALKLSPLSDVKSFQWGQVMLNLGLAFMDRQCGNRADNIEEAINSYQKSLEVNTNNAMPEEWATVMVNLGNAYLDRIKGDKADNIEKAINAYQQSLKVNSKEKFPLKWATVMLNIGYAYYKRISGDRTNNIEKAIKSYQKALKIKFNNSTTNVRPLIMMNMGNAYIQRNQGNMTDNIEKAIELYQQALQVINKDLKPFEWAKGMMNLGNAFINRFRGKRENNIEEGIITYQQALEVITKDKMPFIWSIAKMNMGIAFFERIQGEREKNIENAILAYNQALEIITKDSMPFEWAKIMMHLGISYSNRIKGKRIENFEKGIELLNKAHDIYSKDTMPNEWEEVMVNIEKAKNRNKKHKNLY